MGVGAQYEVGLDIAGTVTPRFDVAYQDTIYTSAVNAPTNRIDDYTVANTRLTWQN